MTPDALIELLVRLDPLADLPRTGWLMRGVAQPESVAAHSHGVALAAMAIVDALRDEGETVDGERVLRLALLHDAAEAASGDIPGPLKTRAVREALYDAESEAIAEMLPGEYVAVWKEAVETTTREASIVKAADKIQMMTKALVYERQGRGSLDDFWAKARSSPIGFAERVHETLRAMRNQDRTKRQGGASPTPGAPG